MGRLQQLQELRRNTGLLARKLFLMYLRELLVLALKKLHYISFIQGSTKLLQRIPI